MKPLVNKRAFITGASSGIGQGIAIAYAREGADVVFSYKDNKKGAEETLALIQAQGVRGIALQADHEQVEALYALASKVIAVLGVDILVNNAGILTKHEDFLDIPLDCFEKVQAVNVRGPFILMQVIAEYMRKEGILGSIINISSISADIVSPGLAHYECSKAALNALTKSAASSLAPYGIRVNAIAPGLVATSINQAQREKTPDYWSFRVKQIPLGRVGCPEDIAHAAVFLASEASNWVTGSILEVDGGSHIPTPFRV